MIRDFLYYNPVKLVFGEGKLAEAGTHFGAYGTKAFIVTTGNLFKENGLVDRLRKILGDSGVDSVHYPDVGVNPLNTQIDVGAGIARAEGCDLVLGLGGGSAIDAAKGIAAVLGHRRPIWDFCTRAADGVIRYMGASITNDPAMPRREDLIAVIRKAF